MHGNDLMEFTLQQARDDSHYINLYKFMDSRHKECMVDKMRNEEKALGPIEGLEVRQSDHVSNLRNELYHEDYGASFEEQKVNKRK